MGYLGLDIGSTTVKACLLDFDGREVVEPLYLRSQGRIFETIQKALEQLAFYDDVEAQVGVTGSGREMVCRALGLNPKTDAVTEITAHAIGARHVFPAVRAIIDIGGQDSKIIQLNKPLSPQLWRDQEKRKDIFYSAVFTTVVGDFVMNDLCAAGTGAFLEMHGRDLGFDSTADFALSAADAVRVARVSGRCSVLAHSDVVHLRQAGESTAAIAAGLCRAVARNVLALVGGRKIETPILFQGGVAGNLGVVKALREELGVGERELVVPRRHAVIGALGAALHAAATFGTDEKITLRTLRARVCRAASEPVRKAVTLPPLPLSSESANAPKIAAPMSSTAMPSNGSRLGALSASVLRNRVGGRFDFVTDRPSVPTFQHKAFAKQDGLREVFLGLDAGSASVKAVALAADGQVIWSAYALHHGRLTEALDVLLKRVQANEWAGKIQATGVTGSGRDFVELCVGTDFNVDEITAQAAGSRQIAGAADAIVEIGGQDSKFIVLKGGQVADFEMNRICAAGTGAFLMEAAKLLGVSAGAELDALAFASRHPAALNHRCCVFAKSDIVSLLNSGASAADAAAGAIYAVAKNYLTLVVGKRPLGRRAAFLGGVARHQTALTAALRALRSDVEFFVPAGGDVCGALGVACLTREACRDGRLSATRFPAGKHATLNLPVAEFDCKSCANVCRVKKWKTGDGATRFSGGTCGRYEDAAAIAKQARNFTEEYLALLRAGEPSAVEKGDACETIGVPRALTYYEQGPLWTSFLSALGFRVVVSQGGPQAAARGALRSVNGSVCLPIKVLLGHAEELEVQGVSRAFFPTVIEGERRDGCLRADACMLVQVAVASFLRASFPKIQWVSPVFHYRGGKWVWREALLSAAAELGRTPAQARQALVVAEAAWAEFAARRRKLGAEFMAAVERGEPCAALLGRAYSFAPESDSGLPRQFARLGIVAAPAAILPFEETEHLDGRHVDLIFKSAQDAVLSSKWVMRRKPNLFPVVLNQFLCRQDAAVLGFVAKIIESRPHLQLTLDENSGEAGFKTRCAAFAQVVAQTLRRPAKAAPSTAPSDPFDPFVPDPKLRRFTGTVWVGGMPGFFKAAFDVIGLKTKIIPDENRAEAIERGRKYFTHGEPCLPFVGLAGTLEQLTENPEFNPQEAMLFLPGTRHCASAALSQMFKDVFAQLGVKGVTIVAPRNGFDIDEATAVFGLNFGRSLVRAMLGEEYLQRLLLTIRPYEVQRGEATEVFKEVHEQFIGSFGKHEEFFFALRRAAERLAAIPVRNVGSRPKILVTGEYVVRTDKFLNDGIHQKIEALGGEALRAPLFADYAELLCRTIHSWQWRAGHYLTAAKETFFSLFRNGDIKRMYALMKPYFKGRLDPDLSRYLASDKIPLPPETDPVMRLELYQALWNLEQGDIAGLVNVAPFGCSISTAVLPILHKTAGSQAPLLSLWFDGQAGAHTDNRLAAFMECVRARQSPATHWAAKRRVSDPAALVRL